MSLPFAAILYDMDGLLIDTQPGFRSCDETFFAHYAIPYDELFVEKNLKGNSMKQGTEWIKKTYKLDTDLDELLQHRMLLSEKMYETVPLKNGVHEIVEKTKVAPVKTAIASGNTIKRVEQIVQRYNWHEHFDALASSDHVGQVGKPAPDVFLYAAKKLEIPPEACIVFEDATNGVLAAKRAGMTCIAVRESKEEDLSLADLVVDSLEDPRVYEWLGLHI